MPGREERETWEKTGRPLEGLPVIRRGVAGIDWGSEQDWVCAATRDRSGREGAHLGARTAELIGMAEWLKARQVELPGRDKKSDPTDWEWMQRLHSCGRLRGSFRPEEAVCRSRTLVRDKANLVAESGDWLRRMQKSLDPMNVRVQRAVFDIDGGTGMAILRAIVRGERDAQKLAKLRDRGCSKTQQEIAEQWNGYWRDDHIFSLQQALKRYDAVQERIAAYEQEILRKLGEMERAERHEPTAPPLQNASKARTIKKLGQEAKRQAL